MFFGRKCKNIIMLEFVGEWCNKDGRIDYLLLIISCVFYTRKSWQSQFANNTNYKRQRPLAQLQCSPDYVHPDLLVHSNGLGWFIWILIYAFIRNKNGLERMWNANLNPCRFLFRVWTEKGTSEFILDPRKFPHGYLVDRLRTFLRIARLRVRTLLVALFNFILFVFSFIFIWAK